MQRAFNDLQARSEGRRSRPASPPPPQPAQQHLNSLPDRVPEQAPSLTLNYETRPFGFSMEGGHQVADELGPQVGDYSSAALLPEQTMKQLLSIDTEDLESDTSSMDIGEIRCHSTKGDN